MSNLLRPRGIAGHGWDFGLDGRAGVFDRLIGHRDFRRASGHWIGRDGLWRLGLRDDRLVGPGIDFR
ncbi:hypothetical protein ASE94_03695 [Devosia sp. Leaf64]|nr:hypothetical protein ASE94_03695 [Devosia sp. Leaf64]KQT44993.1 hypothetical protein ASG47_16360 [Devosia sp. Leaf420]